MTDFNDYAERAGRIWRQYDELNMLRGTRWDEADLMAGFVGDVGDLSKLIMAKRGRRPIAEVDRKLRHELADCLWSVLVLADRLKVDLATEFEQTMDQLEQRIAADRSAIESGDASAG